MNISNKKDAHRRTLLGNRLELARSLCLDEVLQYLVERTILSDIMVETITSKQTKFERNVAFLTILPNRGPRAYDDFIQALIDSCQTHLATMLHNYEKKLLSRMPKVAFTGNISESLSKKCNSLGLPYSDTDSPDGSHKLFIEKSSLNFYESTKLNSYKMTSRPRGYALVISISKFVDGLEFAERHGNEMDRKNLLSLLHQLEYNTTVIENCTANDMTIAIEQFAKRPEHQLCDSSFIAVLSHGQDGSIYGSDGRSVSINFMINMFDNRRCRALQNKPKIFLIQACRGDGLDVGIDTIDGPPASTDCDSSVGLLLPISHSTDSTDALQLRDRLPTKSDIIIGYATSSGHTAMRNTNHGSWYIQALVRITAKHAKDKDFAEILTLVNASIRSKEGYSPGTDYHGCKVTPEFCSSLCKKLYFYPGIFTKR